MPFFITFYHSFAWKLLFITHLIGVHLPITHLAGAHVFLPFIFAIILYLFTSYLLEKALIYHTHLFLSVFFVSLNFYHVLYIETHRFNRRLMGENEFSSLPLKLSSWWNITKILVSLDSSVNEVLRQGNNATLEAALTTEQVSERRWAVLQRWPCNLSEFWKLNDKRDAEKEEEIMQLF